MDKKLKIKLVSTAKSHLIKSPYDAVHDLRHHQLVWKNCKMIVMEENLKVDMSVLEIASYWHDLQRSQEDEFMLLREALEDNKVNSKDFHRILSVVDSHSYGKTQRTIEAMVLFDADKIEYVNADRSKILLLEYKTRRIGDKRFNYYVKIWQERISSVRKQLHFKYSKLLFEERLLKFKKYISNEPELSVFTQGIVV